MKQIASQVASMTGFARAAGTDQVLSWVWELRSVNGRGLELRLKLPPGFDAVEMRLRAAAAGRFARGTIQASLTLGRDENASITVDRTLLARLAGEARALMDVLPEAPPPRIETLMALPGVVRRVTADDAPPSEALLGATLADFETALAALADMRAAEGARLADVLAGLLGRIALLHQEAALHAAQQPEAQRARMTELVRRLLGDQHAVPADRLAQEVALLATRSDVTEEIDRLASHIEAARGLLATGGPIGRQLDFLVQEFMREANTLCSKSASAGLTAAGLQLKAVIEQVREQVQNVE
jgi:uncharacterized protein (TIGR00255 family)